MGWQQTINANLDDGNLTAPWDGPEAADWYGLCLLVARSIFRLPADRYTAWEQWEATDSRHLDRNLPSGVTILLWFEHWGTYYDARIRSNRYGNWGHVVAYRDGVIYSSPISHKAYFDRWGNIETVEQKYRASFVGWSEGIGSARVVNFVPDDPPAPTLSYTIDAVDKQILVRPGHSKWNLDLPSFNDISSNPLGSSPTEPITAHGVLRRSDLPQYAYYVEDMASHQGYNTLDCDDYAAPPPPPPPQPEQHPIPGPDPVVTSPPVTDPANPLPTGTDTNNGQGSQTPGTNENDKPSTKKSAWWVRLLIKLFPAVFHNRKQ